MILQSEWKKAEIKSCNSEWHNGNSGSEKKNEIL